MSNRSPSLRKRGARLLVCLALSASYVIHAGCVAPTAQLVPAASHAATVEEVSVADSYVEGEELSHEGYTARRRRKVVPSDFPPEMRAPGEKIEVEYAVLERKGRVVLTFDAGIYHGGLNAAGFGLLALFGGAEKQLVVSQDAPRTGRQWVVRLGPRPRVIFDGPRFDVGRERDDMRLADLDGDGVLEIIAIDCGLYGFDGWVLAPNATPLPIVVFKYDPKAAEYLPANRLFRDYLLKEIAEERARVADPEDRVLHLASVLAPFVNYVYAGEEQEAWAFFDAAYALPDKARVRREIETALRARPVYRFMYPRRLRARV